MIAESIYRASRTAFVSVLLLTPAHSAFGQEPAKPAATPSISVLPLETHGVLQTEAPYRTRGFIGDRICDNSGAVYVRYMPQSGPVWSAPITKIDPRGKTKSIPMGQIPNLKNQSLLAFSLAMADKVVEIIQGEPGDSHTLFVYYAEFDQDGSLISKAAFDDDFFPYTLVPLPSGDFFAAGAIATPDMQKRKTKTTSIAAIFGPDARIKQVVRKVDSPEADSMSPDPTIVNGRAVLADDGNIYVFLAGNPVQVQVIDQSGAMQKELKLPAPMAKASPAQMFVSGGRIVVTWTPLSEEEQPRVGLYEAQSGSLLRLYEPKYSGAPVCFEEGKTLTIMSVVKAGFWAFAKADVQ